MIKMWTKILNKYRTLETWQKVLCITALPIAIVLAALYFAIVNKDDISEILMGQRNDNLDDRVERAEERDEVLATKEEAIKIEKKALLREVEANEKIHTKYAKCINDASSIDELRAIARSIRE